MAHPRPSDRTKPGELLSAALEIQKARMTLQLSLWAGAVGLTAAGFQFETSGLFLLAALVVPLAFICDLVTKRKYMAPVLYKWAQEELTRTDDPEPLSLLFISYNNNDFQHLKSIMELDDVHRRKKFRRHFTYNHIGFKVAFFGSIVLAELALAIAFSDRLSHLTSSLGITAF